MTADDSPEAAQAQGIAEDAARCSPPPSPIGSGCPRIRSRSNSQMSPCGSTPRRRSGPARRRAASGLPHNEARAEFVDIVTYVLTERAIARIGRGWLTREDREGVGAAAAATCSTTWRTTPHSPPRSTSSGRSSPRNRCWRRCTHLPSGCARRAPTQRCSGQTATPGRCPTSRCSTNSSTCSGRDKPADDPPERERKAEAKYAEGRAGHRWSAART